MDGIWSDMSSCYGEENVEAVLRHLLQEPKKPDHNFVCNGATRSDVYTMAAKLYGVFTELAAEAEDQKAPICLAVEDKSVIAAALLAALASGSVLVLPHSFSKPGLAQMQEVTGVVAAVVDVTRDLPHTIRRISCDTLARSASLPVMEIKADTELIRIFTGGSTGTPKIWSKTAGNIFGEALYMASRYQICNKDSILATVSPYHIYGFLFSVVIPLVASAVVSAEIPTFPAEIVETAQQQEATILVSVPPHYRVLKERNLGATLRLAFSSAGMLEKDHSLGFASHNTIGVVEVYGSTETGGLATRNRSIGQKFFKPLEPVCCKIRQERLYVQSPFLSPDLTVNSDGFFLSGDRVREEENSEFSLHGRADAIIKVAGIRVDLDEVRDFLQTQPGVEECVVLSLPDTTGRGNRIAALLRGNSISINQIKASMVKTLDSAALPKCIKVVADIPVTTNGKYDRDAICAYF